MRVARTVAGAVGLSVSLTACVTQDRPVDTTVEVQPDLTEASDLPRAREGTAVATPVPVDGNRWVQGSIDVSGDLIAVDVGAEPRGLVGAPLEGGGTLWVASLVTGRVAAFVVDGLTVRWVAGFEDLRVTPDAPPVLVTGDDRLWQVLALPDEASTITTPLALPDGRVAYVTREGTLQIGWRQGAVVSPPETGADVAGLLRDTRLVLDRDGRIHALGDPTDRYAHGVLGDTFEAATLVEARTDGLRATVTSTTPVVELATGTVVEGTSVVLADVDGDGTQDRLVTVSGPEVGAQVVALVGDAVLASEPIGQGNRWRHVIGVLPGPDGPEVVEVVTPHLGRRLQFLGASAGRLEVLAAADSLSASHTIGSRDLDQALLADVAGIGPAYLGPGVDRSQLIVAQRDGDTVDVRTVVDLGAEVSTNLATVVGDGRTALGVGVEDGRVLVWPAST